MSAEQQGSTKHRFTVIFEKEDGGAITSFARHCLVATRKAKLLKRALQTFGKQFNFTSRAWLKTGFQSPKKIFSLSQLKLPHESQDSRAGAVVARSVREIQNRPRSIPQQLAFRDVGEVSATATELHHAPALTCHCRPFRSRIGILFDPGDAVFAILEIDGSQPAGARLAYRIYAGVKLDSLSLIG